MYIIYSGNAEQYASAAVSKRTGSETSIEYLYLGRVLDREKGIYKSKHRGVFQFYPATGEFSTVPEDYVPPVNTDARKRLFCELILSHFSSSVLSSSCHGTITLIV